MKLEHLTYTGTDKPDFSTLEFEIPDALKNVLNQINGFIQYHGGLHIRGICKKPEWHSLQEVMTGKFCLYKKYKSIHKTDLMFAQDCMADQYFIREDKVYKLYAESGEIEYKDTSVSDFINNSITSPVEYLEMEPLLQFQTDGNNLEPGEVLHAVPPFCTKQAENKIHSCI